MSLSLELPAHSVFIFFVGVIGAILGDADASLRLWDVLKMEVIPIFLPKEACFLLMRPR